MSVSNRSAASVALVDALRRFLVLVGSACAVLCGGAGCVIAFYSFGLAFRGDPATGLGAFVIALGCFGVGAFSVWLVDVVRGLFATSDDRTLGEARRRAWDGADR